MLFIISKSEVKSFESTLECIGLETVKVQELLGILSEEEVSYYIDNIKFADFLSDEEIKDINDSYGEIIKVKVTSDEYTVWINPEFVKDYMELYKGVTVNLIKSVADAWNTLKVIIKPLIESFTSKWINKINK